MKKAINTITNTVTFTFDGLEAVVVKAEDVTPSNRAYAALHGLAARIGDSAAIAKSEANAYTVTEAMRRDAVVEMVAHLTSSNDWNMKVSEKKAPVNATIAAIAAKLGVTYEEAQAKVAEQFLADLV